MKNRNRMIVNGIMTSLICCSSLSALAASPPTEVKIVRDEYGMPHIYADDTYRLFYGYGYFFPAFNLADCAITVGAVMIVLDGLRKKPVPSDEQKAS